MSSRSCSRRSISKQRGALMSSRLMPPNDGAIRTTVSMISSTSRRVQADRHGVDAAELLEQQRLALHHRQRGERAEVAEPEHRGAVGDDGDDVASARCSRRRARGRRRSPRSPARRPACTPAPGPRRRGCARSGGPRSCRPGAAGRPGRRRGSGTLAQSGTRYRAGIRAGAAATAAASDHRARRRGRGSRPPSTSRRPRPGCRAPPTSPPAPRATTRLTAADGGTGSSRQPYDARGRPGAATAP